MTTLPKINLSNKTNKTIIFEQINENSPTKSKSTNYLDFEQVNKFIITPRPNNSPYKKKQNDVIITDLEDIDENITLSNIRHDTQHNAQHNTQHNIQNNTQQNTKIYNSVIDELVNDSIDLALLILSLTKQQHYQMTKNELNEYCNSLLLSSNDDRTQYNKINLAYNILINVKNLI